MRPRERAAIDAVARWCGAEPSEPTGHSPVRLRVAGKQVRVEVAALPRRRGARRAAPPRLRFDKVASRLVERLRRSLAELAPDGVTAAVTITAPIRVPAKTTAVLEDRMRHLLARDRPRRDERTAIHGNRVRVRIRVGNLRRSPAVVTFVHNPDGDARRLLDIARDLGELFENPAVKRVPKRAPRRWLAVTCDDEAAAAEAYRHVYSQLRPDAAFERIVMVFNDGQVAPLG